MKGVFRLTPMVWLELACDPDSDLIKRLYAFEAENTLYEIRFQYAGNGKLSAGFHPNDIGKIEAWLLEQGMMKQ